MTLLFRLLLPVLVLGLSACCTCGREESANRTAAAVAASNLVRLETSLGNIDILLNEAQAPISTRNFLTYVDSGRYDGVIFHRVIPGFVIQSGGHTPDLAERAKTEGGGEDKDPKITNEWGNGLTNVRGSVGMARDADPDSATRQFYINLADNARLDIAREVSGNAGYAVFAQVVAGMEVVDAIAAVATSDHPDREMANVPVEPVVLIRARRVAE